MSRPAKKKFIEFYLVNTVDMTEVFTLLLLNDGLESLVAVVVIGLDNRWCVKTVTGLDIRCVEDVT